MKLLLDQNISHRLTARLAVIVTNDADFHHMSLLYGAPPKVIWLRLGNASTDRIASVLLSRATDIEAFAAGARAILLIDR